MIIECDLDCLTKVLRVFSSGFKTGFGEEEILRLVQATERLDSGRTVQYRFTTNTSAGIYGQLVVETMQEDASTVAVKFHSSPPQIIESLRKYLPQMLDAAAAQRTSSVGPGGHKAASGGEIPENSADNAAPERPVLAELRQAGFILDSFQDLRKSDYRSAVPILMKWFDATPHFGVKSALLKLILDSGVHPMPYRDLLLAWERMSPTSAYDEIKRWEMASVLGKWANELPMDDLSRVIKDKRHGKAREMFVIGLGTVKDPRATNLLLELLRNGDLISHALEALRKHRAPEAIPLVEQYLNSDNALVEREAKKTLAAMRKAS